MLNTTSRARQWPSGRLPVRLDMDLSVWLSAWVEPTGSTQAVERTHRLMLFAILCVGTWLRFWGLGNVGLRGDEETMALAAMEILRHGAPILPSGMFYPRGLTELYLMVASVAVFGESEWAFRLPSALCGIALIALTYLAGRRYLRPTWNLALTGCVAMLPEFIVYAQTARMYGFLLAAIAGCMACLHLWERDGRTGWLILAAVALLIGIELHSLAVTAVLLFVVPGIVKGERRVLIQGIAAAILLMLAFAVIDGWVNAQYPTPPADYGEGLGALPGEREFSALPFGLARDMGLALAALAMVFLAVRVSRMMESQAAAITTGVVLIAAVACQWAVLYHVALLLHLFGLVMVLRWGRPGVAGRAALFLAGCGALAIAHVALLAPYAVSTTKLIGLMVGQPSVWPYVRVMQFSVFAGLLAACCLVWGLVKLARRERVPDYWLMALLGVWIPMFAIGLFMWNVPSRYTAASILPLLIAAFAFAQHVADWAAGRFQLQSRSWGASAQSAAAALVCLCAVSPATLATVVNAGYEMNPDHQGAAAFMRQQNLTAADVVIAEDVLQQTYYLGKVDYWLLSRQFARKFVQRVDGEIRDFYTGTRVISDAAMLDEVLRAHASRRVFVIGSGENREDQRRAMRGDMDALLHSPRFRSVYLGRDGFTQVWLANDPVATAAAQRGDAPVAED